jgi:hypothetical protein
MSTTRSSTSGQRSSSSSPTTSCHYPDSTTCSSCIIRAHAGWLLAALVLAAMVQQVCRSGQRQHAVSCLPR